MRERPTYRVAHNGTACSLQEVLAVLVGVEAAQHLLATYDSAHAIAMASAFDLERVTGLGPHRVALLRAATEFGRRMPNTALDSAITSPQAAADLLTPLLAHLEQEHFYVLPLNTRQRMVGEPVEVYRGSLNTAVLRTGEIFREAIRRNAAGVIVAHNHPSGDPSPSPEDVATTRALIQAGQLLDIEVLDHLVIGRAGFVSLKERGLAFNSVK